MRQLPSLTERQKKNFLAKFNVGTEDECWNWLGKRSNGQYGQFGLWQGDKAKVIRSHVMSYLYHTGPIPEGQHVLHTCDNAACVNPNHLYLGTHQQNMKDKVARNRQPYGENHKSARFSAYQVADMRALWDAGLTQTRIAEKYNCNPSTVHLIVRNKMRLKEDVEITLSHPELNGGKRRAKLSDVDIATMRKLHAEGVSMTQVSKIFKCNQGHTCRILKNKVRC